MYEYGACLFLCLLYGCVCCYVRRNLRMWVQVKRRCVSCACYRGGIVAMPSRYSEPGMCVSKWPPFGLLIAHT